MLDSLKRFFVVPFVAYLCLALLFSGYMIWDTHFNTAWLLCFIGQFACLIFFVHLFFRKQLNSDWLAHTVLAIVCTLVALVVLLLILLVVLHGRFGLHISYLAIALLMVAFVGFSIYFFWYTPLDRSRSLLRINARIPEAKFIDANGQAVSTVGHGKAIWVFIRGSWCPICVRQVKELALHYAQIEKTGAKIFVVSAQSPSDSAKLAAQVNVPIRFLIDPGVNGAKALGIQHRGGALWGLGAVAADTIFPTVIVVGANDKVLYTHESGNYRIRPEPEMLIRSLATA